MNTTGTKSRPRPLSPHLQVYSWLITSTLSILHRLTGVVLTFGLVFLAAWLIIAAYYPECYDSFTDFAASPYGIFILGGWSVALFYHLANGIRHLFWDIGLGFTLRNATRSGYAVLITTVVLTALTWSIALGII